MFLVDASGSVHKNNFRKQLDFITEFADNMPIHPDRVRIGIVLFATHAIPQFNMNEYHDRPSFKQAVRRIQYPSNGGTNTADGLKYIRTKSFTTAEGARDNVKDVLIVITDGDPKDEVLLAT